MRSRTPELVLTDGRSIESMRWRVFAFGLSGVVIAGAIFVGILLAGGRPTGSPPVEDAVLYDRPEVRPAACPSTGVMVWRGQQWEMQIGPVVMQFAGSAVADSKIVAARNRSGWLVQKIPLRIDAPPDTPFSVHGFGATSGAEMVWEGTNAMPPANWPVSERTFAPGHMAFPEAGCYQLFVQVDGVEYGPFGFVVTRGG